MEICITRFDSKTIKENKAWLDQNNLIGCIYGSPIKISEKILKRYNLQPMARLVDYQVAGVEPYKMGIGPVKAIPKVLKHSGLNLKDIDLIELNEAFASQSLAVIDELGLNKDLVNVNGGAIALGHPLGATGAKLSVQLLQNQHPLLKHSLASY